MDTLAVTRRFDLTDAQWARLEPLLPAGKKPGRPSRWSKRQLIHGIRWRVRVGAPWRDVPEYYGSWQAVYSLFRRWQRAGVWQQILTHLQALADAAGLIGWQVGVDSTVCRAHQHAAGAAPYGHQQAEPPGGLQSEPADHALGRSRGGLSTKLHLACEQGQRLLALVVTARQRGDAPQFPTVMAAIKVPRLGPGRPRTRPEIVRADKAYSSRAVRQHLRSGKIRCTIPEPADASPPDSGAAAAVAARRPSTRPTTEPAQPSSAASTGSNATAASPPGTTNSPFVTRPPSTLLRSTTGSRSFETRPGGRARRGWRRGTILVTSRIQLSRVLDAEGTVVTDGDLQRQTGFVRSRSAQSRRLLRYAV